MGSLDKERRQVITDEFALRLKKVGKDLPDDTPLESLKPNAPIGIRLEGSSGESWRGEFKKPGQVRQLNRGLNLFHNKTRGSTVGDVRRTELEQMSPGKKPGLVLRLLKKVF